MSPLATTYGLAESRHHFGAVLSFAAAPYAGAWVDRTPRPISMLGPRGRAIDWTPHYGVTFADGSVLYTDYRPHLRDSHDIETLLTALGNITHSPAARAGYLLILGEDEARWAAGLGTTALISGPSEASVEAAIGVFAGVAQHTHGARVAS